MAKCRNVSMFHVGCVLQLLKVPGCIRENVPCYSIGLLCSTSLLCVLWSGSLVIFLLLSILGSFPVFIKSGVPAITLFFCLSANLCELFKSRYQERELLDYKFWAILILVDPV